MTRIISLPERFHANNGRKALPTQRIGKKCLSYSTVRPYIFYLWCGAFAYSSSHAQQPTRVSALPSDEILVTCTKVLPGGRQYNAGWFTGAVDFDPDPNHQEIYYASGGGIAPDRDRDAFFQVLNWDGSLAWAYAFGTESDDAISDIEVDANGNLYIAGTVSPYGEFDMDPGDDELMVYDPRGAFLAKYSFDGKLEWAIVAKEHRPTNRVKLSYSQSIAFDPQGNLTWGGSFTIGGMDFITPQGEIFLGGEVNPNATAGKNGFLVNVDQDGKVNWVKDYGTGGDIKTARVAHDEAGNLFVGGVFQGNCDFDPSEGTSSPNYSPLTSRDSYLMKLDQEGNFEWIRFIRSAQIDWTTDLVTDQEGNIIVTGIYDGSIGLDPVSNSVFVSNSYPGRLSSYLVKLDGDGDYLWGKTIGNVGQGEVRIYNVELDDLGQIYFSAGQYFRTDIDMGPGEVILAASGGGLVEKLSPEGDLIWWKYLPRASRRQFGIPAFHVGRPTPNGSGSPHRG